MLLTQVGPTPMGEPRRCYLSRSAASQLHGTPVKPMRLMGEDLVLIGDIGGRVGLIDWDCPDRRADLLIGLS